MPVSGSAHFGRAPPLLEAQEWIAADPSNAEVLFPYLNGEDLNSRPDTSASRWVIDFNDHTEAEAATYALSLSRQGSDDVTRPSEMPENIQDAPDMALRR